MKTARTYVYKYNYNSNAGLGIYLCDAQAKNRAVIVPLTDFPTEVCHQLTTLNKFADITGLFEAPKDIFYSPLYLHSQAVKINLKDFETITSKVVTYIMSELNNEMCDHTDSLGHFQDIYQFLMWKKQKFAMNVEPYSSKTTIYENGLYWASLGVNVGSELNKDRPVLVWKKRTGGTNESAYSYIVIPISSRSDNAKYYMNVPIDINGKTCYIRTEDMKRINIKRISRPILDENKKIIFIDNEKREEIKKAIEKFYIFDNKHNRNATCIE